MSLFTEKEILATPKHLLIDADSLIYKAAFMGEKVFLEEQEDCRKNDYWDEFLVGDVFEHQKMILDNQIDGIIDQVANNLASKGGDLVDYKLLYTPKQDICDRYGIRLNFRYEIVREYNEKHPECPHPEYKANRRGVEPPKNLNELYDYAFSMDNVILSDYMEVDDLIVWMYKQDTMNNVIACIDKDIIEGTAGTHFNYTKGEWITTEEKDADLFYYRQCMIGDPSDGIKGIARYGKKTAEKDFPEFTNHKDMWQRVLAKFLDKGYSEDYALLMMRLVNLNQVGDKGNGDLKLWTPEI